jgi:5-(carboxyamino)imidazole ribonucleotide mutase
MPPGIPVATVAINGAKNAGLLAAKIIGNSDATIREKVKAYQKDLETSVLEKAGKLEEDGFKKYLDEMNK